MLIFVFLSIFPFTDCFCTLKLTEIYVKCFHLAKPQKLSKLNSENTLICRSRWAGDRGVKTTSKPSHRIGETENCTKLVFHGISHFYEKIYEKPNLNCLKS